jgi:hypothetical protein
MPTQDLPIHEGMVKAVDEVGLTTHQQAMYDCYVDELGVVNRRPGLVEFCDLGTSAGLDGLFWWQKQEKALAISNGSTFELTDNQGNFSQITHDDTDWEIGTRVTFADFATDIFGANGAKIKQIPSSGNVSDIADADAPTSVTHVAELERFLLANNVDTGECHRSDVNAPTSWQGNYFEAEAKKDDLVSLLAQNLELFLQGKSTLEVWANDGSTPFSRLLQGYISSGTIAPYSFTWCNTPQTFCALNESREVVRIDGRTPVPISASLSKYIQGFSTVNDAIGDSIVISGRPYYSLAFPTEGVTIIYDFKSDQWYNWAYWNKNTAEYERFRGNCYCLAPDWNYLLVGDRANGKIYRFSDTTYQDNSQLLRTLIRTGHINWGTPRDKKCLRLEIRVKRTEDSGGSGALNMYMRYRNNGQTSWTNQRTISLSAAEGEAEYQASLYQLGMYKSRQWEFVLTDNVALGLAQVQETFEYV